MLRCKRKQLTEHCLALVIDRTQSLEDHSAEEKTGTFEADVVLPVLLNCSVVLARVDKPQALLRERARHCDIDGKTVVVLPVWDRNVARPAASGGTKDALLLKDWLQQTIGSDAVNQVAKSVVPNNKIPILCAACGVVAINVDRLHAQRTGNLTTQHWKTQAVGHCNPKQTRLQKTILAVILRGHGSDKSARVWARDTKQALLLALVGGRID
jgi:hypothetical protein